jgi:Transcriptional regulator SbtR-like, C-terminal domain
LSAALTHALTYRGLAAAVLNSALDRGNDLVSRWHAEMFEVGAALLARARQSGAVGAVADEADVLKIVGATSGPSSWLAPEDAGGVPVELGEQVVDLTRWRQQVVAVEAEIAVAVIQGPRLVGDGVAQACDRKVVHSGPNSSRQGARRSTIVRRRGAV